MTNKNLSTHETRSIASIATIYGFRMLGLFMILPVFAVFAQDFPDYSPTLAGLAIGIYGLTQALFQIPFGMLSDRYGRKKLILIGLLLFAVGSIIAALSTSLIGVIIGRALQGSGAIASVLLALTADLTKEENRTKSMAMIGMSIGLSFSIALMLGPILTTQLGLQGLFWLTALLALISIALLYTKVPSPVSAQHHRDTLPTKNEFVFALKNMDLMRLNIGIGILHFIMTATFTALPLMLSEQLNIQLKHHTWIYLGVLILSFILMFPLILYAEKKRQLKSVYLFAIFVLCLAQLGIGLLPLHIITILILMVLYFSAFNCLEASLPSLVSKYSPATTKGTAMGIYSTAQFLGAFAGGLAAGVIHAHFGLQNIFLIAAGLALLWYAIAFRMSAPPYLTSYCVKVRTDEQLNINELADRLATIPGVAEAIIVIEDNLAYLKIDKKHFDKKQLAPLNQWICID